MKLTAVCCAFFTLPSCRAILMRGREELSMHAGEGAMLELSKQLRLLGMDSHIAKGDPEGDMLATVATMITNTFVPNILSSHNSTQKQLQDFRDAFDLCPEPKIAGPIPESCECKACDTGATIETSGHCAAGSSPAGQACVAGGCSSSLADYNCHCGSPGTVGDKYEPPEGDKIDPMSDTDDKMKAHALCRAKEGDAAATDKICQDDLKKLADLENTTCKALKNMDSAPSDPVVCHPTDPYEEWLATSILKVQAMKSGQAQKKEGCGNATQLQSDKKPECEAAAGLVLGNKTACDHLQAQAEAAACVIVAGSTATCTTSDACYDVSLDHYNEHEPIIKALQHNWTVQWRVLKRMECLLKVMQTGGTNDDIDDCKATLHTTDHLDLDYPTMPPRHVCPATLDNSPCGTAFMQKHYGSLPETAPAATCTPCDPSATPDPTTATAAPATGSLSAISDDPDLIFVTMRDNQNSVGSICPKYWDNGALEDMSDYVEHACGKGAEVWIGKSEPEFGPMKINYYDRVQNTICQDQLVRVECRRLQLSRCPSEHVVVEPWYTGPERAAYKPSWYCPKGTEFVVYVHCPKGTDCVYAIEDNEWHGERGATETTAITIKGVVIPAYPVDSWAACGGDPGDCMTSSAVRIRCQYSF